MHQHQHQREWVERDGGSALAMNIGISVLDYWQARWKLCEATTPRNAIR
jgi:hypothetical protein